MIFPRLRALSAYWQEHPPLRLQVAGIFQALLGIDGPAPPEPPKHGSLDDLIADFMAMGGKVG